MSDTPGARVHIVENPHRDPVTVAHSKHDAMVEIAAGSDDEIARMQDKLDRARAEVEQAKLLLGEAKARKAERHDAVKAAKAELDAAADAAPVLADEVNARRAAAKAQRTAELQAELARLNEGT